MALWQINNIFGAENMLDDSSFDKVLRELDTVQVRTQQAQPFCLRVV